MKILEARIKNVLGCRLAEIEPQGDGLVIVAGKNGAGKSSILDAIMMTVAGLKGAPARPIREGAGKGECTVDLGDLKVRRTFTPSGGKLEVTSGDGRPQRRAQELLDSLLGRLAFDPLQFTRVKPAEQAQTLRDLAGLDFTALEAERAAAYHARTEAGREVKRLEAQVGGRSEWSGVPDQEISVADLAAELKAANETNAANAELRRRHAAGQQKIEELRQSLAELVRQRDALNQAIAERETTISKWQDAEETSRQRIAALADVDTDAIAARLADVERTNAKVRENQQCAQLAAELAKWRVEQQALTGQIDVIDGRQAETLAAAKFPVDGLAVADDGVTFRGIPFGQLSTAQQTGVSFSIAAALNPKLRIAFIRNGNDLDCDSLDLLRERAEAADFQLWIERIEGGPGAVVIEAGEVLQQAKS
jgi:hypothetical protein